MKIIKWVVFIVLGIIGLKVYRNYSARSSKEDELDIVTKPVVIPEKVDLGTDYKSQLISAGLSTAGALLQQKLNK